MSTYRESCVPVTLTLGSLDRQNISALWGHEICNVKESVQVKIAFLGLVKTLAAVLLITGKVIKKD